jgi:nitronate monooxygenase
MTIPSSGALATAFTRLLGCRTPLQQAPMGAVSGPRLATAVADAGGVGTLSATGWSAADLADRLDEVVARTHGVLAVNVAGEPVPDVVVAAAERVPLVDFFWSDPRPDVVDLVHRAGALACWQVGSDAEARAAVDAGCDLLAVQGTEAGGHVRGTSPLLPLLDAVLTWAPVPVLAAGGLSDRAGVAAVLGAGAAGARVGTRFLATPESAAHPGYKQAVLAAGTRSTVVSADFADCPLCRTSPRARVLRACVEALADGVRAGTAQRPASGRPPTEDVEGPVAAAAMYAGEGVGRISGLVPVAELMAAMCPPGGGDVRPCGNVFPATRGGAAR